MNIVDILIMGLILLGALQGYRKGLITGLAQFAGSIIGFLVASLEYIKVLKWLEQFFPFQRWLEPVIYRLIGSSLQTQAGSIPQQSIENLLKMLPPELRSYLAGNNILGVQSATLMTKGYVEQAIHGIAGFITEKVLALLAFALVFLVIVVLIQALITILLAPLGIFGGAANRGGGLLFGGLFAFSILVVISGVFSPMLMLDTQIPGLLFIQHSFFQPYLLQTFQFLSQSLSLQISKELQTPFNLLKGFSL
ncbi:MAG: CvpA family protein [Desulfitobacteriaceae bacterium]